MRIEENIPLAPLTTFRVGGRARWFTRARALAELREALAFARAKNLPIFILGGGSNTLVADEGFEGLVIKIEVRGIELAEGKNKTATLIAAAGEPWDGVVEYAVRNNLWGLENLSGIPGTAGAAPVQNIGAYGVELADALAWVDVLDTETGEVKTIAREDCGFGYRGSAFKKNKNRFIIARVALTLMRNGAPNLAYRDLAAAFAGNPSPSLRELRDAVLGIRSRKFPDLAKEGTAGSFFLNPTVSRADAERLAGELSGLPQFPGENGIKISLAHILDKGLGLKDSSVGRARLFERQPLVVVAEAGASARDVRELAEYVAKKVRDAYGIELEWEVQSLGAKQ